MQHWRLDLQKCINIDGWGGEGGECSSKTCHIFCNNNDIIINNNNNDNNNNNNNIIIIIIIIIKTLAILFIGKHTYFLQFCKIN